MFSKFFNLYFWKDCSISFIHSFSMAKKSDEIFHLKKKKVFFPKQMIKNGIEWFDTATTNFWTYFMVWSDICKSCDNQIKGERERERYFLIVHDESLNIISSQKFSVLFIWFSGHNHHHHYHRHTPLAW